MKYNLFASAAQPCPSSQLTAELPGVSLWVGPHLLTFHQNCSFPAFTNFAHTKPEPVLINPLDLHQQSSVQPLIFSLITSPTSLWCLFSPGPSAWESSPSSSLLWAWNVLSFISFAFFFFLLLYLFCGWSYPQVVLFSQVELRSAFLLPACLCMPILMSGFVFPFIFDGWL